VKIVGVEAIPLSIPCRYGADPDPELIRRYRVE